MPRFQMAEKQNRKCENNVAKLLYKKELTGGLKKKKEKKHVKNSFIW